MDDLKTGTNHSETTFEQRLRVRGASAAGAAHVLRSLRSADIPAPCHGHLNGRRTTPASHTPIRTSIMKKIFHAALFAAVASVATVTGIAQANSADAPAKLLSATFEPRHVVQVEVGDFHFKPGQIAPVHTHDAPAVGYVAKGAILYQVEGERPQILRTGDAFYEPTGKRILRFDNASASEEAVFIDFNLEQKGEPFIVFEEQPRENIDRRSLPTVDIEDRTVAGVDIYSSAVAAGGSVSLDTNGATLGLVAGGIVEITAPGGETERVIAGKSFAIPADATGVRIVNASAEVPAEIITFHLR